MHALCLGGGKGRAAERVHQAHCPCPLTGEMCTQWCDLKHITLQAVSQSKNTSLAVMELEVFLEEGKRKHG